MNKKFNLLVGSGIHVKYLTGVNELTKEILDFDIYKETFLSQDNPRRLKIRSLIHAVYDFYCDHFKNIISNVTYEDIYYIVNEIYENAEGKKYQPAIDNYTKLIFEKANIEYKDSNGPWYIKIASECKKVKEKIEGILEDNLTHDSKFLQDDYHKLLFRLYEEGFYNSIFSLNHDTILEDYFNNKNILFNDGFYDKERVGFGEILGYNRQKFITNTDRLNIIKLHGSINWNLDGDFFAHSRRIYKKLYDVRQNNTQMIIGSYNKVEVYNSTIFLDFFNFFYSELFKCDNLVIIGYGFNDRYINNLIKYWIYSDSNRKMIVVDPGYKNLIMSDKEIRKLNPEEIKKFDLRETFLRKNHYLLNNENKIYAIEKPYENVQIEDILENLI